MSASKPYPSAAAVAGLAREVEALRRLVERRRPTSSGTGTTAGDSREWMEHAMTTHTTRAWPAGALGRLAPAAEDRPEDVHRRVTLLASTVDSGRAAVWLDCPDCGLDAGPYLAAEAQQLAGAHDDRIHRGRPTALIICGGAA